MPPKEWMHPLNLHNKDGITIKDILGLNDFIIIDNNEILNA